jgi:hypothetical protein
MMKKTPSPQHLAAAAALGLALGLSPAAQAESLGSAASSASSAGSASIGSLSDSVKGSSNSSTRDAKVADGDYRVIEVAAADGKPGMLQLLLRPGVSPASSDGVGDIWLTLPAQALGPRGIAVGDTVSARQRAYGYEFARGTAQKSGGGDREAFFLVLNEGWQRELQSRALTL